MIPQDSHTIELFQWFVSLLGAEQEVLSPSMIPQGSHTIELFH